jgi:hypothetical protein
MVCWPFDKFCVDLKQCVDGNNFSDSNELCLTFHFPKALNADLLPRFFNNIELLNDYPGLLDKGVGHRTQGREACSHFPLD